MIRTTQFREIGRDTSKGQDLEVGHQVTGRKALTALDQGQKIRVGDLTLAQNRSIDINQQPTKHITKAARTPKILAISWTESTQADRRRSAKTTAVETTTQGGGMRLTNSAKKGTHEISNKMKAITSPINKTMEANLDAKTSQWQTCSSMSHPLMPTKVIRISSSSTLIDLQRPYQQTSSSRAAIHQESQLFKSLAHSCMPLARGI